jgi:Uri superfamily endonuclease
LFTLARTRAPTTPLRDWPDSGVYQLWLRVSVAIRVRVGRLGTFRFPAGRYVYTGRAARGLRARVQRHIRGARCQHWHIDYLLARRDVRLERVTLASPDPRDECVINQATCGTAVVPGFGASDCRQRCRAHLLLLSPSGIGPAAT